MSELESPGRGDALDSDRCAACQRPLLMLISRDDFRPGRQRPGTCWPQTDRVGKTISVSGFGVAPMSQPRLCAYRADRPSLADEPRFFTRIPDDAIEDPRLTDTDHRGFRIC